MTITIKPDGTAQCLYAELIDLSTLGRLRMTRASTIEFDEKNQVWQVQVNDAVVFSDPSRQACLEWEQQNLN